MSEPTEEEIRDSLGIRAFAAWCNVDPEYAAVRPMWKTRGSRLTLDAWSRVADVYMGEIMVLRQEIAELKQKAPTQHDGK